MPRVTTKGQVTIPKEIREALGIEPGDEVSFEETETGYTIRKHGPRTADDEDPFAVHRGCAERDESMPERMRRLRGEYPREPPAESDSNTGSETEREASVTHD
jgi:AbrB family looped-hinge helix DNA binding protein